MTENTNKKKVLICIDWFLPGTNSGGPVQSYVNLIEHFKDEFDFYVVTRNTDYKSDMPYKGISCNAWNSLMPHLNVFYLSNHEIKGRVLKKLIYSKRFDVALVNGVNSFYFSILPVLFLKRSGIKTVISARGMLSPQGISVKRTKKKIFRSFFLPKIKDIFFKGKKSGIFIQKFP